MTSAEHAIPRTVLVLGATGMLGHKACQVLAAAGQRVVGTVRGDAASLRQRFAPVFDGVEVVGGVDVLDDDALERVMAERTPDHVLNAVGLVKQLDAASDPYLAVAINSLLPHRLARLCGAHGARLIHISTDCVFDGRRGQYREDDLSDADDLYGRSKALGETTPGEAAAVTLRTSFIGRELPTSAKPTHGLVEWFLAQAGGEVKGFSEAIYTGLTSLELARVVRRLVEDDPGLSGVFQVASEPISKYDLLRLVRRIYQIDVDIHETAEPRSDRSMVMGPFHAETGYSTPPWKTMIRDMYEDPTPYATLGAGPAVREGETVA